MMVARKKSIKALSTLRRFSTDNCQYFMGMSVKPIRGSGAETSGFFCNKPGNSKLCKSAIIHNSAKTLQARKTVSVLHHTDKLY